MSDFAQKNLAISVTRVGAAFEVASGDVRMVKSLGFISGNGGPNGDARSIRDDGAFILNVGFTDDSNGVFLFDAQLPGDANGDGVVDVIDLGILGANYVSVL